MHKNVVLKNTDSKESASQLNDGRLWQNTSTKDSQKPERAEKEKKEKKTNWNTRPEEENEK